MSENFENIEYQERLIAFIDIMGFKEIIRKSDRSPGTIELIYSSLAFLKRREIASVWDMELIEIEEDAQKKNLDDFNISSRTRCSSFSDSIVVSVECSNKNINESLSTLVANLSFIGSRLMSKGVVFRGAITIGKVVHTEDGIVFGQGLIDAYLLESSSANYPRIIISDKLLGKLNYPLDSKRNRYPYHQYLKRFPDGCLGFHQMIYFEVLQSWEKMSEEKLINGLTRIKKTILSGLDSSFENPGVFAKYMWLKEQYDQLMILYELKPAMPDLSSVNARHNIHYSNLDKP